MSFYSNLLPHDAASQENAMAYAIRSILNGRASIEICSVKAVNDDKCDVLPLVSGIRTDGTKIANIEVHNVLYWRLQAGTRAVIMKPTVGDIGLLLICDKDITNVKDSGTESVPGSLRRNNPSDGIYLGSIAALMSTPTEYVELTGSGINIVAPNGLKITGDVSIEGAVTTTSSITADGEITGNGIALSSHVHGGVESGGSKTSEPE